MIGHGGSSAGSYLADPTSPNPSHCASIVATSTIRVNKVALTICCIGCCCNGILRARRCISHGSVAARTLNRASISCATAVSRIFFAATTATAASVHQLEGRSRCFEFSQGIGKLIGVVLETSKESEWSCLMKSFLR